MNWLSRLLDLLRTVDALLQVERKHGAAIDDLKERVSRLEAAGPVVVAEAKGAAAAAASLVAAQHDADLARRIGILEAGYGRSARLTRDRGRTPTTD